MTISNEAVEAAVRRYHQSGLECSPDAMRAALEAAAPYMFPAPEGVSEAEKGTRALTERLAAAREMMSAWVIDRKPREQVRAVLAEAADALSSERERAERAEDYKQAFGAAHQLLEHAQTRADRAEFLLALALECARKENEAKAQASSALRWTQGEGE